jgi:hypothetical protein
LAETFDGGEDFVDQPFDAVVNKTQPFAQRAHSEAFGDVVALQAF